jgi:hypothetical protein
VNSGRSSSSNGSEGTSTPATTFPAFWPNAS